MKIKILFTVFFAFAAVIFSQTEKESLFKGAHELLLSAQNVNASLLSPDYYEKGISFYRSAEKDFDAGKDVSLVYDKLQNAETYLYKAVERSKINSELFALTLKLRDKADLLDRDASSNLYYKKGEEFFKAAIKLSEEDGNKTEIEKNRKLADDFFEGAIIIAQNKKLLSPVIDLKNKCKKNHAELFSPTNFNKGNKFLDNAFFFARSGKKDKFVKSVLSAELYFKKAFLLSQTKDNFQSDLLTAYSYADNAEARKWADTSWSKAVTKTKAGGIKLESDARKEADKDFVIGAKLFWDAERDAIFSHYVNSLKLRLDSLTAERSEQYAPNLTRRAELLVNLADGAFKQNRYDKKISRYYSEADGVIKRIKLITELYRNKEQRKIDSLVLNNLYPFSEKKLSRTIEVAQKDETIEKNITKEKAENLHRNEKPKVKKNKALSTKEVSTKREKVKKSFVRAESGKRDSVFIAAKFGKKTIVKKHLSPLRQLVKKAEEEFDVGETVIIKGKKKIRIRLVGLKLAAYERKPSRKNLQLLKKLKNVINSSSDIKRVVVEVYSDSWGGDVLNRKLSAVRARTVKKYLTQMGVSPRLLRAKGIGNKNPIASNDTFEGRNKNRRVEVVIYLK